MKLRFQKQRNRALTFPEVLVVVAILVVFVYMFLPVLAQNIRGRNRSRGIFCVLNLNQVNLSFRIWEGDHDNKYPMGISVTNGGAMETTATGDVVNCYRVMSNELSTPMILVCPADWKKTPLLTSATILMLPILAISSAWTRRRVTRKESCPVTAISSLTVLLCNPVSCRTPRIPLSPRGTPDGMGTFPFIISGRRNLTVL